MENYISKTKALIDACDEITGLILADEPYMESAAGLCSGLSGFLPDIAALYMQPEYCSHLDDLQGWTAQIQRLIDAMGGNDTFLLLDVISYEIKYNLMEIQDLLKGAEHGCGNCDN